MDFQDKRQKLKAVGQLIAMCLQEDDFLSPEYAREIDRIHKTHHEKKNARFEALIQAQFRYGDKRINPAVTAEIMRAIDKVMAEELKHIHEIAARDIEIMRLRAEVAILRGQKRIDEILDERMKRMEREIRCIFNRLSSPDDAHEAAKEARRYVSQTNADIKREMQNAIENELRDMQEGRYLRKDPVAMLAARIRYT